MAWTPKTSPALKKRAAKIKVVLMDVDGTITDGSVTLLSQPDGSAIEIKTFDAHDGQGMTLGRTAGLRLGVITGRESAALRRRMKEMGVEFVYEKQPQKIAAYEEILKKAGVEEDEVAYPRRRFAGLDGNEARGPCGRGRRCCGRSKKRGALYDGPQRRQRRGSRINRADPEV